MKHKKTFISDTVTYNKDVNIIIEGPVNSESLKNMTFDEGLNSFRVPKEQFEAIIEISDLPEGRIIIARVDQHIIGYTTYLYPDPLERWSDGNLPYIIELGAIELSLKYRKYGLGKKMLKLAMKAPEMEDFIVITTEYYWHWDLKNSGLDVYQYQKIMHKMMAEGGLEVFATDDPEIISHPANSLMARIGKNIKQEQMEAFDKLRFMNRFFF
ncbi:GNAT family N-acetyltransferase [Mammaliicoccus vitulinus]|uniref:GNAT family N-acetyltransferase n=1 Tax=Mammaliicoccus vitulinus TaxID=71237 RepID=A0ABX7HDY1_9STAP|nr:GNAT family N-acetyltransferase [Mammaliicoccus vitulinus]MEB7658129.1 GNAT family N-acetyltransferase [Mammaliicoccus vitulinus]PNZ39616.1 N-acetyltransferase [Mammaliicoccus vitulinus]QRO84495.1 GNAT family N-acetyltransferase [Mammaliicoccus vitulinus]QTN11754.1 GNAT family N-acetyltransferase [Mammaliicoccus vitulinus]WQK88888.1 GNAT family N-acetyltransferase [Mammaliicoccus vitulinus]